MKFGNVLDLPDMAIAEGATSPNPGSAGALLWSTTTSAIMRWNGSTWASLVVVGARPGSATFSYRGTLATGVGKARLYASENRIITNIWASVGTTSGTNSVIADVNIGGTTIFSTQANRPTITAGAYTDLTSTPNTTAWNSGAYITVDIDQIGATGNEGTDLTLEICYTF